VNAFLRVEDIDIRVTYEVSELLRALYWLGTCPRDSIHNKTFRDELNQIRERQRPNSLQDSLICHLPLGGGGAVQIKSYNQGGDDQSKLK
jgi:hypothetical protein